jgi:hypothetical protein
MKFLVNVPQHNLPQYTVKHMEKYFDLLKRIFVVFGCKAAAHLLRHKILVYHVTKGKIWAEFD